MSYSNYMNSGVNNGVIAKTIYGGVTMLDPSLKKRIPTILPSFIEKLSKLIDNEEVDLNSNTIPHAYEIDKKMKHNSLIKYQNLIEDYGAYYRTCDKALNSLDDLKPNQKVKILTSVNEKYKEIRRQIISDEEAIESDIDKIRKNSDLIMDILVINLSNYIKENYDDEDFYTEDLELSIPVFLCYAFAECKVLENIDSV